MAFDYASRKREAITKPAETNVWRWYEVTLIHRSTGVLRMEFENRAEWNAIRGPATLGLIMALSCGGLSLALVATGILDLFVILPLIAAGALGPLFVSSLGLQARRVWTPRWLEILPDGFVGYPQRGPAHYSRIEVAWRDISAFEKPVGGGRLLSFDFPQVKAVVRRTFQWNAPLSTLPDQVFSAHGVQGRVALTEENLDSLKSAYESWRRDQPSGPAVR